MEILSILRGGPRGPTRLAQATGLSFDKFMEVAAVLDSRHFIEKSTSEGHDTYFITSEGNQLLQEWEKVWTKISPDSH